jgi:uracil-DNA glycosylase
MNRPDPDRFFAALRTSTGGDVFNPWSDRDASTDLARDAAVARQRRLAAHLSAPVRFVLIGEAAGYQGCKVSGIPFTSERLLLEGAIPRVTAPASRLTSRARPWSEPSATTVWKTLHTLGIAADTVLWNAYPWHPHKPGTPHSNRTPTRSERLAGVEVLQSLLALVPQARVFAVGRNAEASLAELGIACTALRHPSMGGAMEFSRQLQRAVRAADQAR